MLTATQQKVLVDIMSNKDNYFVKGNVIYCNNKKPHYKREGLIKKLINYDYLTVENSKIIENVKNTEVKQLKCLEITRRFPQYKLDIMESQTLIENYEDLDNLGSFKGFNFTTSYINKKIDVRETKNFCLFERNTLVAFCRVTERYEKIGEHKYIYYNVIEHFEINKEYRNKSISNVLIAYMDNYFRLGNFPIFIKEHNLRNNPKILNKFTTLLGNRCSLEHSFKSLIKQ